MAVDLALGLKEIGLDVGFASLFSDPLPSLAEPLSRSGIPTWFLGKSLGWDIHASARLSSCIRRFQPDIIHTHRYALSYLLPLIDAARRRGTHRIVHTVHNLAQHEVGPLGRALHRLAFAAGAIPVAIARQVQESIETLYGLDDVPLIHNGVPTMPHLLAQSNATKHVVLGCVARFDPQKNLGLLLEAFDVAACSDPRLSLVLVGDGPLLPEAQRWIERRGLANRIALLGYRTDAQELIRSFDIFLLTSKWEGHPLAVLEAMANNKPVIATRVGGVTDIVVDGETGILVPSGDRDAIVRAVLGLAADSATRVRMGNAGRRRVEEHFSKAAMVEKYASLYRRLCDPPLLE